MARDNLTRRAADGGNDLKFWLHFLIPTAAIVNFSYNLTFIGTKPAVQISTKYINIMKFWDLHDLAHIWWMKTANSLLMFKSEEALWRNI